MVLSGVHAVRILANSAAVTKLNVLDDVKVNPLGIVDVSVGVGCRYHLGAQLLGLFGGEDGHVARTGDDDGLALEGILAQRLQGLLGVVAQAVTRGLGPGQGAAEGQVLAGQHARVLVAHSLVLAEQVADLTGSHVDVAGGHIGELADVALQLSHEGLAEAHDLGIRAALGVEVGSSLGAAHRQPGQRILQNLLEAQELDDRLGHGRVEAKAALVGADGRIELDPVAAVDLHMALVIGPGHTELDCALGLDQTFQHAVGLILWMPFHHGFQAGENFTNSLQEFRLVAVALLNLLVYALNVFVGEHLSSFD